MEKKIVDEAVTKKEGSRDSSPMTCFVIMPISDVHGYREGHFREVYDQLIKPAVESAGYSCDRADSTNSAHMIRVDIVNRVVNADLCICDLSTNNPNVLFEYGIRQAFDKPTILIKDYKTKRIFDLNDFRDIEYDSSLRISNTLIVREKISNAIRDTVAGSGDSEQIFSLVKLMKIQKAAMSEGELSQDDARFEIIERKLDSLSAGIAEIIERSGSGGVFPGYGINGNRGALGLASFFSVRDADINGKDMAVKRSGLAEALAELDELDKR